MAFRKSSPVVITEVLKPEHSEEVEIQDKKKLAEKKYFEENKKEHLLCSRK